MHVNAFQRGSKGPVGIDLISYLPVKDDRGRLNAKEIQHAGQKILVPRKPSRTVILNLAFVAWLVRSGVAAH